MTYLEIFVILIWGGGGEHAPNELNFLVNIFQKVPKNSFFGLFFKNLPAEQKIWSNGVFIVIWESSENQFGRPKKMVDKIFNFI